MELNKIYLGDAFEILKTFPSNCVDAVVTDPPYGLEFMSQKWDREVPPVRFWKEVLRVMKPGAHLLSFFGTRTYHRGVVNIEDAGFEIRDMIQWLYGSGFPKSMDISKAIDKEFGKLGEREVIGYRNPTTMPQLSPRNSDGVIKKANSFDRYFDEDSCKITAPATPEAKQWQGWGTSLKPACEPIVLARKPLSEENVARNVLKWSVGGLNVDACRIPVDEKSMPSIRPPSDNHSGGLYQGGFGNDDLGYTPHPQGRFPANVILDEDAAKMLDKQSGISNGGKFKIGKHNVSLGSSGSQIYGKAKGFENVVNYGDSGGASRFFYCAKAGRNERFAYCKTCDKVIPQKEWDKHKEHELIFHTTVKPLKLMEYLVRLVTPPNGVVLDPFLGTGTTAVAALKQGFKFVGIEINEYYYKIAEFRVNQIKNRPTLYNVFK